MTSQDAPAQHRKIFLVSGGFDPIHGGHIDYLRIAKEHADRHGAMLFVALNSDAWLVRKKGYYVLPWKERRKILSVIGYVDVVIDVDDRDDTVCDAIRTLSPHAFVKGGDRTAENTPEAALCAEMGVEVIYGAGEKVNASQDIMKRVFGEMFVLAGSKPGED